MLEMVAAEQLWAQSWRSILGAKATLSRICASLRESVAQTFSLMPISFLLLVVPGGGRSILQ